uniref:Uncharacterized protein n=1 Tax=Rhizophora mucronata TaxID=61149 RepID=A0A2P2QQ74_RHIMU
MPQEISISRNPIFQLRVKRGNKRLENNAAKILQNMHNSANNKTFLPPTLHSTIIGSRASCIACDGYERALLYKINHVCARASTHNTCFCIYIDM